MKSNDNRTFVLQKKVMPYVLSITLGLVGVGCTKEELKQPVLDLVPGISSTDIFEPEMDLAEIGDLLEEVEVIPVKEEVAQPKIIPEPQQEIKPESKPDPKPEPKTELKPEPIFAEGENPYLYMTYDEIIDANSDEFFDLKCSGIYRYDCTDCYIYTKRHNPHLSFFDCAVRVNLGLLEEPYDERCCCAQLAGYSTLVNKYHYKEPIYLGFSDDERLEPVKGEEQIEMFGESRGAYEKMREDASKAGINLKAISGYCSIEEQERRYNEALKTKSVEEVEREMSKPSFNDCELGISVELDVLDNSKEYNWLQNNAHKYGFITRYPKGKEEFTLIKFKPGYYRYLGVDLATKVKESGFCFEEYYQLQIYPGSIMFYRPQRFLEENNPPLEKKSDAKVLTKTLY